MKTVMAGTGTSVDQIKKYIRYECESSIQKARLQMLSVADSKKRDTLNLSEQAHRFSKESIAALVDKSANASESELGFYFSNYNNVSAILDAINFGENVACGYDPDFKDYGVISFDLNGKRQIVPNYAVPRIKSSSLPAIEAQNNNLKLDNRAYYCWHTSSGDSYTWTVNNGKIQWADSESLLEEPDSTGRPGNNHAWEMRKASWILSDLARGKSLWGYSNQDVIATCSKVGINKGFFSVDAGAGKHSYILKDNGRVVNVDKKIEQMNKINWIEMGYKAGDEINVYGKKYPIAENGHINASADDGFTSQEIRYPSK